MMHTCDTDRIATKQRFNAILQFRPYDGMLVPTTHIPSTPRVYGAVGCTRCLGVATPPAPSTSSQLHLLHILVRRSCGSPLDTSGTRRSDMH